LDDESVLIDLATNDSNGVNVSPLVLARGARGQIALHTRGAKEVVHGESVAFVEIAVLDNLIDGRAALVAELRNGEKLGVSAQLLDGNTVDVVPGLALAARGTLHGLVDGVLGVVVAGLCLVEDTGRGIKLQLQLSGQSALEIDSPQGLVLADRNSLNLRFI
jgi:hypothetical protein